MAYNKKDFKRKTDNVFSEQARKLLKRTTIENMDFEEFLNRYSPSDRDFIFLDPPYDSEFSEYEENAFTKEDQERLARLLYTTEAQFILIIKETPFIRKLYEHRKEIKITDFDKTYSYNIRGRNERDVKHLIIHNLKNKGEQTRLF
jgi:DNA adenine methylase